jgi:hypothetical protein
VLASSAPSSSTRKCHRHLHMRCIRLNASAGNLISLNLSHTMTEVAGAGAIVSFVSAGITFIDFSSKLIKLAKLMYDSGTDHTPDRLDANAYLRNLNNALQTMRYQVPIDRDVQDLIARCTQLAKEIQNMFPPPGTPATNSVKRIWKSTKAAYLSLWHKTDFEDKLKRVDQLTQMLHGRFNQKEFE